MRKIKKSPKQRIVSNPFASIRVHSRFRVGCSFLCAFVVFVAASAHAQSAGGIRGMVYDQDFDAPLAEAVVSIVETGEKVTASAEGNYVFGQVEPGTYTLVVSKDGYTRKVFSDVVVPSGKMTDVDASLAGEFTDMEEFVVQDLNMGGASEEGLLNLRMETPALMDSVGSDLMSRAGASDAAGALRLVAGATVQDGKYAVVRGLPDRYVNSQMNSVRLPSADPDKRAVQLDQFPSSLIESIQVSKTFTPDQQGDASGGAVNVILKGIPEEGLLKLKVGTKYKTALADNDFLTYKGGGMDQWGDLGGDRTPQPVGAPWKGAVGVSKGSVPDLYDWNLTAGGKHEFGNGIKIGGLANVYYKKDASSRSGIGDKYWVEDGEMIPNGLEDGNNDGRFDDDSKTALFDVQQSSDEVQWGNLFAIGAETERNAMTLLYMRTHVAEDKATLAEDTRGKEFVYPGYDPATATKDNVDAGIAPYRRFQTLEYSERDTDTLQVSGDHTLPFPNLGIPKVGNLLDPKFDWTLAKSSSSLTSPDKRMFGSVWAPGYHDPGFPPWVPPGTIPPAFGEDKPGEGATLGNVQRVWKEIIEESDQLFLNGKFPFEQWSGDEGFLKVGYFKDIVERTYDQDTYSNFKLGSPDEAGWDGGTWEEYWSDHFPSQGYNLEESFVDVDYTGNQEISAWYYMVDIPLCSFFKIIGGQRYESTTLTVEFDPEKDVVWTDSLGNPHSFETDPPPNNPIEQNDILPALGFEFEPHKTITIRAHYSETVARPTFKEFSPIQQMEYSGGDVFVGNSALTMSALKNYDLRVDYRPYDGGLISASWFLKEIEDPIEYTQRSGVGVGKYITAVNYPEGTLSGFEFEARQHLGHFWSPLEGLSVGGNATLIKSEVTLSDEDALAAEDFGYPEPTRDMLNAPEHLYNVNLTYDIAKTDTKLGLFYTVKGDTLVAGSGSDDGHYVPSVYATEFATLNFSLSQKIGEHLTLSFKAKNLLDPEIEQVYRSEYFAEDTAKTSYKKGMDFSISLSGEF